MKSFRTFTQNNTYLIEAKSDRLDVSIPNADKVFSDHAKFFEKKFYIEEKVDGVKLTLFRNNEDFDSKNFENNWIVAYKNSILNFDEFSSTSLKKTVKQGSGISQYKIVFEHLKKYHKEFKSIPKNTEFFLEFLINSKTLTRDYSNKHQMVLIGYTHNAKIDLQNDFRFYTKDSELDQKQNSHYAEILKVDLPMKIFEGKIDTFENLRSGIEHSHLKSLVNQKRNSLSSLYDQQNWSELFGELKNMLLDISSFYGGKSEGVVLKDLDTKKTYKFLQDDQHDAETRNRKKNKTRMSREEENKYFDEVREIAKEILADIGIDHPFSTVMKEASTKINSYRFPKKMHTKKNDHQVREDLHTTFKSVYESAKNGWAGVVGKFRIITKEHVKMIEYALDKYKGVSIMIVQKDNELAKETIKILEEIFEDKDVEFFTSNTGNIINLEKKTRNPIVAYICGPKLIDDGKVVEDREKDYQEQLSKRNYDRIVDVYDGGKRDNVSATKAEQALRMNDVKTLKRILHPTAYKRLDSWSKFYV